MPFYLKYTYKTLFFKLFYYKALFFLIFYYACQLLYFYVIHAWRH